MAPKREASPAVAAEKGLEKARKVKVEKQASGLQVEENRQENGQGNKLVNEQGNGHETKQGNGQENGQGDGQGDGQENGQEDGQGNGQGIGKAAASGPAEHTAETQEASEADGAEEAQSTQAGQETVQLTFQCQNIKIPSVYKVKSKTVLSRVVQKFCEKEGLEMVGLRVLHNGKRVQLKHTVARAGLRDGSRLDVNLPQTGG